jgi:Fe2+ transport system protein B
MRYLLNHDCPVFNMVFTKSSTTSAALSCTARTSIQAALIASAIDAVGLCRSSAHWTGKFYLGIHIITLSSLRIRRIFHRQDSHFVE